MPKQIVADVFETLGGVAKATGQQVAADVKKAGEDAKRELGITPQTSQPQDDKTAPVQTEEQYKKIEEATRKRTAARYEQIQGEIKKLQEKRLKEIPKAVSGKPGFDEGKMVKQLGIGPSFAGGKEGKQEEKKKLPPLPVRQASRKTEIFRGVSG